MESGADCQGAAVSRPAVWPALPPPGRKQNCVCAVEPRLPLSAEKTPSPKTGFSERPVGSEHHLGPDQLPRSSGGTIRLVFNADV